MKLNLEHIHFQGIEPARRVRPVWGAREPVRWAAGATGRGSRHQDEQEAMVPAVAWVMRQFGLAPEAYRPRALSRRVGACQRQVGVRSPEEIRPRLEREPALLGPALNALLIGVTEFFRDRAVFDRLREEVLPDIIRRRSSVRVYAPGVSSGEELYSVAMLLAEAGVLESSELTGVDCRPEAVARARAAEFAEEDLATVPAPWRERYFVRTPGGSWSVRPAVRERLHWHAADLFTFALPEEADLILFRNVAIYFSAASAERAWAVLLRQLAPGGWLVTGRAEKPPAHAPLVRVAPSVYRKLG